MALTQIQTSSISSTVLDNIAAGNPAISNAQIANSSWSLVDDTAIGPSNSYFILNGNNFASGCLVFINNIPAASVTRVSATQLRVSTSSANVGIGACNILVSNPDGGTAYFANAITSSTLPAWVTSPTLANTQTGTAISVQLQATGAVSYTLAPGSSLPTGLSLAANGLLSGTHTLPGAPTTYSFIVNATDSENQDSPQGFSIRYTLPPSYQAGIYVTAFNVGADAGLNVTGFSMPFTRRQFNDSPVNWNDVQIKHGMGAGIRSDGTLWTWGNNGTGKLGHNDLIYRSSPTQVGTATDWSLVALGLYAFYAIKTNGTLWAVGSNQNGHLGFNISGSNGRSSPVQISGTWSKISGNRSVYGIKTDGTLWSWGENGYGNLGIGRSSGGVIASSPMQIGSATDWSEVAAVKENGLAVKTGGTLWSWGRGEDGMLGLNNNNIHYSSPVQVGSGSDWSKPFGGGAIKTNGTLWAWGMNSNGELGQNDIINRSSPVQVGSDTNWSIALRYYIGYGLGGTIGAVKSNGTLWACGKGPFEPALNQSPVFTNVSTMTQVGTANTWKTTTVSVNDNSLAGVILAVNNN